MAQICTILSTSADMVIQAVLKLRCTLGFSALTFRWTTFLAAVWEGCRVHSDLGDLVL